MTAQQKPPCEEPDEELFALAVRGATPLPGKGRAVPPAVPRIPAQPVSNAGDTFSTLLDTSIEFDLESTHEYIQGNIRGLDLKIFRKLKAGGFSFEAHLDLHGYHVDPARLALLDFMKEQYEQGKRCVLIIPGRGKNSPLGMGILRQGVLTWLTQDPIKRIVLAFCTAQPKHGGAGAIYVLLRNNKKGKGKIVWDKMIFREEG